MARKLISLEGATIVVPAGWTATAGYGQFAVDGTVNNGTISSSGDVMAYLQIGYNGNFEDGQTPTANYVWGGSYGGISNSNALNITITGGDDADSESLIQWLLDNNAEITGGVYEAITQLAPFLTNIANAIRTKKGTTETINAQDFASEIESISGGLTGYTGTITFTGLTNYYNISYLVIHSDGTYEKIESVSETNNVNNAIYIVVRLNYKYALAGARETNATDVFGDGNNFLLIQITGDNWVVEFYEDL